MIVSTYYNKENDVIILSTNNKCDEHVKENGIQILYKEKNVVGINAYNQGLNLSPGLCDTKKLPKYLLEMFNEEVENPFEVGLIKTVQKHPKSEKLNICQVQLKSGDTQIVCGASNVKAGIKVIVAKVGAVMPNGMAIVPSKLLDVPSNGMICSLKELGRESINSGIEILSDEYKLGDDYL